MTEIKRGRKEEIMEITVQDGFTLKDFLDKIEKMMVGFDPQYIDELNIKFKTFLDDYEIRMTLRHWRLETDQEMNERGRRFFQTITYQETKERAILAQLQEKYGV